MVETPLETSIPHKASLAVGRDPTPEENKKSRKRDERENKREEVKRARKINERRGKWKENK